MRAAQRAALPDLTDDDVVGSAYCIRDYHVDAHLGGDDGLAVARDALARARRRGSSSTSCPTTSRPTTRG